MGAVPVIRQGTRGGSRAGEPDFQSGIGADRAAGVRPGRRTRWPKPLRGVPWPRGPHCDRATFAWTGCIEARRVCGRSHSRRPCARPPEEGSGRPSPSLARVSRGPGLAEGVPLACVTAPWKWGRRGKGAHGQARPSAWTPGTLSLQKLSTPLWVPHGGPRQSSHLASRVTTSTRPADRAGPSKPRAYSAPRSGPRPALRAASPPR